MRSIQFLTLLLATTLAIASCGQTTQPTAVLGGGGSQQNIDDNGDGVIDDAPNGVNEIFSVDELQDFVDAGMTIYLGEEPPDVEGEYLADSLKIVYDSAGYSGWFAPYVYAFSDQSDEFTVLLSYSCVDGELVDDSSDNLSYIAGTDECFSAFTIIEGYNQSDDCTYSRATVFSGCLNDNGIADFSYGFIMRAISGDCSDTVAEGHMRVVEEYDGTALVP